MFGQWLGRTVGQWFGDAVGATEPPEPPQPPKPGHGYGFLPERRPRLDTDDDALVLLLL